MAPGRLIIHPCGMSGGECNSPLHEYPANLAGIPDAPGPTSQPPPPPALDCVNRGLTFAPVKKGTEDGVMHDYFSLLLTALYNIYYLYK